MDWGEPFIKAHYHLEGDGALTVECYDFVERVSAVVHTANTPNVQAITQYFQRQLGSSLKRSLEVFKCARLFSPSKINLMRPDVDALEQSQQLLLVSKMSSAIT